MPEVGRYGNMKYKVRNNINECKETVGVHALVRILKVVNSSNFNSCH